MTFDVGGTLIECWPSVGHVYAEVAARNGYAGLSPAVLNQNFRNAWKQLVNFRHTPKEWAALVDATFGELVQPAPSATFFDELYARFSETSAWRVFDDVHPILQKLKSAGLALGIISNWDERLRPLLGKLDLSRYFDSIIVSFEVGVVKPDRGLFLHASAALNCAPEHILHVGDSYEMDVQGARAAGLQTRWLRRDMRSTHKGCIASLELLNKI